MPSADPEIRRAMAVRAIEGGLLRLKWLAAATRFEIALKRHDRALKLAYKYGYNPAQPRVSRGNPDGGQWTDANGNPVPAPRTRLAGEIPTGDPPKIPKEPPPTTRLTNILVRTLARALGPRIWIFVEAGSWLYDHKEEINSFFDPPKSLEELQDAATHPEKGYDIHHIVERSSAAKDESEDELIDAPENLVGIPRWRHWLINGWYATPNEDFGFRSPRNYLADQSWEERRRVGLYALVKFGVLRP